MTGKYVIGDKSCHSDTGVCREKNLMGCFDPENGISQTQQAQPVGRLIRLPVGMADKAEFTPGILK